MGLIVQKFGGTSVGSVERFAAVAATIRATREAGHRVVVVISAMGGETIDCSSSRTPSTPTPIRASSTCCSPPASR